MRFGLLTFCLAITLAAGLALAAPSPAADTAAKPAAEPAAKAPSAAEKPAAPAVDPKAKTPAGDAPTSDAQFFAELGYKDAASAHDVARAMVILASEGKECGADFEKCKAYLKRRGVLPDGWLDKAKAEDPVDKSALASLVCRSLDIKGGLWMRLFGPQPRFALRECIYHELMVPGADYAYVSGGELVGVIDRCDRWRAKEAGRELPKLSTPAATEVKK